MIFFINNDLLVQNNEFITSEKLMEGEKYIIYNQGVEDFLNKSLTQNYIISGGLRDFLLKLKISDKFDEIYGSSLIYNENGMITRIGEIMTDDMKISAIKDILKKNNRDENDCRNVYYIGDGYSDSVAMEYVHNNNGKSIFVYQENKDDKLYGQTNEIYQNLNKNGMIDYFCLADYRENSKLFNILQRKD